MPKKTKKEKRLKKKLERDAMLHDMRSIFSKHIRHGLMLTSKEELMDILRTEKLYIGAKKTTLSSREIDKWSDIDTWQESFSFKNVYIEKKNNYVSLMQMLTANTTSTMLGLLHVSDIYKALPQQKQTEYEKKTLVYVTAVLSALYQNLSPNDILTCITQNPYHKNLKSVQRYMLVLNEIPHDITSLFPNARKMNRHFILHIGDTNTGKTYDAVQDYMSAKTGVFLGPLRLLAMETQEKLMNAGVPCSLLTGEEEDFVVDATHIASTIEMLNTEAEYDVCVIDEAQMISDKHRGWAWTKAILGVCAERVHVCMSENARNLVIELIKKCEDTFEIVEHKRNTPLVYDATPFFFPTSVKKNDALIVFSRQKVLRVAAELRANGIEPSVIYGALPYSVRKNEIHRFMSGETSVIVSTDAIGMGMNLPVKRIVFLESTKFDGTENRLLLGPEIKQIAGRAGRQGMFNVGHFTALSEKEYIQDCFYEAYKPLKHARIQLPEKLLDLDIPLSTIIKQWMTVTSDEIYEKEDMEIISEKCAFLESLLKRGYEMDKRLMWRFITIPFDEKNYRLKELWEMLVVHVLEKGDIAESVDSQLSGYDSLEALEIDYKILDLYFSFARTIHYNKNNFRQTIMERKDEIAVKIMRELEKKQYNQKKCRKCGCKLSWDYEYGLCEDCYYNGFRW